MLEFIQHCLNGLIIGGAYALIGVGMTMILGIMRVINFAHGEFYMLGAYVCYSLVTLFGVNFFLAFPIATRRSYRSLQLRFHLHADNAARKNSFRR